MVKSTLFICIHRAAVLLTKEVSIKAIFFLQAVASGGVFTRIPDIQNSLGLSETELGLILAAQPVGGFFSFLVASLVVEKIGTKTVCCFGLPLLALASFIFASASILPLAIFGLLLFGMSFSVVNVAMNVEADRVEFALGRRIMSNCHGFWSIGFLSTALVGVGATGFGISATVHLGLVVPVVVVGVIWAVMRMTQSRARPYQGAKKRSMVTWPSRAIFGIVCFGVLGSIVQGGTQNWSVIYMRESFSIPDWMDALTIPVFLITLTLGRLWGDRSLDKFGPQKVGLALISLALFGLVLIVGAQEFWMALIGFAFMGLGVSIIFPMMVTAAAALGDRRASANVAAVTMTTGIGMLIVPPIMGYVAENYGVRSAFFAMVPAFILAFLTVRNIVPKVTT